MYYFQPVTSDLRKLNNEFSIQLSGEKKKKNKPATTTSAFLLKAEVFYSFIPLDENSVKSILKLSSLSGDRSKGFKEPTNN